MTDKAIAVETTISAPFETVWNALRDPVEIRRWHGWEYDGEALADEIDVIYRASRPTRPPARSRWPTAPASKSRRAAPTPSSA
jgi:hypothetical protein